MVWIDTMTTQVNVRLDDVLLTEIDALTKVLHISRTEWLRTKIARAVKEDTLNLREAISLEYAKGRLTKDELFELLGSDAEEIDYIVERMRKGKTAIDSIVERESS